MATATLAISPQSNVFTWEVYLTEGHMEGRYDIIEGIRYPMSGASWEHQRIQLNLCIILRAYELLSRNCKVVGAPFDVLIRRKPRLQTRQPDLLLARDTTLAQAGGILQIGSLTVAPELVVEIISDSEMASRLNGKLADYAEIGVAEVWILRPDDQTTEVRQLVNGDWQSLAIYTVQDTLQSVVFPDLTPSVADLFLP